MSYRTCVLGVGRLIMSTLNNSEAVIEGKDQIARKAVKDIRDIATLPEIAIKIIKLVEDPNSTAQDLNNIITNDPALGARILKVVNSAFYGLPGQVGSINRAIVLLGLNAVKNIVVAASLAKLFRGGQVCENFNARDLWAHSIAVATATKQLAGRMDIGSPDEAFLAGLIHDLGIMVEVQARPAKFVQAFEMFSVNPSATLRDAEQAVIGATHEDFGAALCRQWKFPLSLIHVTGYHHRPLELPPVDRNLASLVHVADFVAAGADQGCKHTIEGDGIEPAVLESLHLTPRIVQEVIDCLPESMGESDCFLKDAA